MRVILCSGCGVEVPYANTSKKYCDNCRNEVNQKKKNKWKSENSEKNKADLLVLTEIRAKRIIKPTELKCNLCKEQAREYHHFNYNYPLSIIPLCHNCHKEIHKEEKN